MSDFSVGDRVRFTSVEDGETFVDTVAEIGEDEEHRGWLGFDGREPWYNPTSCEKVIVVQHSTPLHESYDDVVVAQKLGEMLARCAQSAELLGRRIRPESVKMRVADPVKFTSNHRWLYVEMTV